MSIADHSEQIASSLLGQPNKALSTKSQLRYGNNGSLAIEITGEKAGTWYDHEGCEGGGLLDLIMRERGGTKSDAVAWLKSIGIEGGAGNGATEPQRRMDSYIYHDEQGQPLYCVSRWGPLKTFTQHRYDPETGKFTSGKGCMKGVPLVPYRLHEWLAKTGRIWVVEGEKDADRLAELGLHATTNPGGAGKWPHAFAQYFIGRDVVVIPDDDQAGHDHAKDVVKCLMPVVASVKSLELQGLHEKGDVSDWLDQGHTVAELEALATEPASETPTADGAQLLDDSQSFLARFISYPSAEARIAHVLWIVHTHMMDAWESTPRIAFLSAEPASGKTRALEISELLVPRPVEAVNVSPAYLFRKVASDDGAPTILFDEIDTVFGPKARENEEIRGLLNAGHRRGAVSGRCVTRGKIIETEEIPAYCAVALAGLGWLPDTLLSRSVVIRMCRRAPSERIEPYRRRAHAPEGRALYNRIADWAHKALGAVTDAWPEIPAGVEDRDADVWEPLLAIADAAGGAWPSRARVAAVVFVAASKETTPSLGIRLLSDLRTVFGDQDAMSTKDIIAALCEIEEAPWSDLKGKPINARGLAVRLRQYGVKSKVVRVGTSTPHCYLRTDLFDPWQRYLGPPTERPATSATDEAPSQEESCCPPAAEYATSATEHQKSSNSAASSIADESDHVAEVADSVAFCEKPEASKSADVADVAHSPASGRREVFEI